ncbi:MAG: alpha/beta hydrolase [Planctomycetia bacterium]|jgi:pimeloyl-ACP methyl ester carboxylesterase
MWNRNRIFKTLLVIVIAVVIPTIFVMARAQDRKRLGYEDLIPQSTLGGKQFWNDVHFFHGWHIQRNAVTGHYRLLDAEEKRHAWGTFEGCKKKLDEVRKEENLPPMKGKAVIILHGLVRSHKAMESIADYLRDEGGYKIINVEYASTQHSTEENAQTLASVIESLDGIEEINFIGHSLGNIVVRRYLHDHIDPKTGKPTDKRIRRMVMLGPPNHGSMIAKALADNTIFSVNGRTGQELGKDWDELDKNLATPPFEFGIIAGGKGDGEGYNPVLPGDDDGTIRIETARLRGATDFSRVPVLHSFLMNDKKVQEQTLRFLQHGYFKTEKERQPIK